jgi:uncharacterized protein involved in exopolysaccharide biosynthesis
VIRQYLHAVWGYRRSMMGTALLCALAGGVVGFLRQPTYVVTATVSVQPARAPDTTLTPADLMAVLRDEAAIARVLERAGPASASLTPADFAANHLDVQPVPGTSLLRVSVTHPDPGTATAVAAALPDEAANRHLEQDRRGHTARREALQTALDRTAKRLEELGRALGPSDPAVAELRAERRSVTRVPASPEKATLQLDYDQIALLYSQLARDLHQMDLSPAATAPVRVIAISPPERATLSTVRLMFLGLVTGLAISVFLVCALAYVRLAE